METKRKQIQNKSTTHFVAGVRDRQSGYKAVSGVWGWLGVAATKMKKRKWEHERVALQLEKSVRQREESG